MWTVTENLARGANGIFQTLDASYASGAKSCAIHDKRIELNLAIAIEETAATSIEGFVVLQDDDGFFHGIQRRAAAL